MGFKITFDSADDLADFIEWVALSRTGASKQPTVQTSKTVSVDSREWGMPRGKGLADVKRLTRGRTYNNWPLRECGKAILVRLSRFSPMRTNHLSEAIGRGYSTTNNSLTRMEGRGLVKKVAKGTWTITSNGVELNKMMDKERNLGWITK